MKTQTQANLEATCPPLPALKAKDLGDLVVYTNDLIGLYGNCRDKHNTLVKTLK